MGGLEAEIVFKKVRTLRLTVAPGDGQLKITAPLGLSLDKIAAFVNAKADWIRSHQERIRRFRAGVPTLETGAIHWVWGQSVVMEVHERPGPARADFRGEKLVLGHGPGAGEEDKQRALDRLYARLVDKVAPALADHWQVVMGVKVQKITVRKMKTRWGSCKPSDGKICLNSDLAKKTPDLLEAVLVHELVHLLEPSHNQRFKALMDRFLPDWRVRQARLRTAGEPVKTDF